MAATDTYLSLCCMFSIRMFSTSVFMSMLYMERGREKDFGDQRVHEQSAQHDGDALSETGEVAVDDGGVCVQRPSEGAVGANRRVFPLHKVLVLVG